MLFAQVIALLGAVSLVGCVSVPERYRRPARVYTPLVDDIVVRGYEREVFKPTTSGSAALVAPQLGIYAAGGGVSGYYHVESDAEMLRYFIEDTRCARRVRLATGGDLAIEGSVVSEERIEVTNILINVVLFLPSILGVPLHDDAYGIATSRIYRNGEFLCSLASEARLAYWTSIYTAFRNRDRALALARGMALRAAADQLAAGICGSAGSNVHPGRPRAQSLPSR
jgi:hypothetical protein